MLNKMQGIGNIGRVEFGYTSTQKPKLKMTVALYRGQEQEALWVTVIAYGDYAVKMSDRLEKGQKVYFEGKLDSFKTEKGTYWNVVASQIYNLSPKKQDQAEDKPLLEQPEPTRTADIDWGDIPF